jgi:hypothetical protein
MLPPVLVGAPAVFMVAPPLPAETIGLGGVAVELQFKSAVESKNVTIAGGAKR